MESASASRPALTAGRSPRRVAIFLAASLLCLAADLALKWWSFTAFPDQPVDAAAAPEHGGPRVRSTPLVPGVLRISLVVNEGAVFGLGEGHTGFFVVVSLVALLVIGVVFARSPARAHALHTALALITAGAGGNLYDRVRYGAVRDMLHLFPGVRLPFGWSWPGVHSEAAREVYPWIFNLADAYLVIAIGILLVRGVVMESRSAASAPAEATG